MANHDHETHHAHGHHHDEEPMGPEEAVRSLFLLAQVALDSGDFESAATAFGSILQVEPNETAAYNLASLYARGAGVERDFLEAARLFRQAELMGNARAGKLCRKCMLDYLSEGLANATSAELYAKMAVFVSTVYPEAEDQRQEACNGLLAVGGTYLNKGRRDVADRLFRAAMEFGE